MKNIIIVFVLLAVIILAVRSIVLKSKHGGGCCGEHEEAIAKVIVSDKNKRSYPYKFTMDIGGMTCENCARRVENALNSLPDTWAAVDISTKKAKVLTKNKTDEDIFRQAVIDAGYTVLKFYS